MKYRRELKKKEKEQLEKAAKKSIIASGARIIDSESKEAEAFAKMYYQEIRSMKTDVRKIAKNAGYKSSEIQRVKNYLFLEKSRYDEETGKMEYFHPDCAIAQSWQRLMLGKDIKPHDLTLIRHELYEMEIKTVNPGIGHQEAHTIAASRFDYGREAEAYYDHLKKSAKK